MDGTNGEVGGLHGKKFRFGISFVGFSFSFFLWYLFWFLSVEGQFCAWNDRVALALGGSLAK